MRGACKGAKRLLRSPGRRQGWLGVGSDGRGG